MQASASISHMFIISQSDNYSWPVSVSLATNDGKFQQHDFKVVFKRIPQSRFEELCRELKENQEFFDKDFCREVVVGWTDVTDSNGQEVPFSQGFLEKLLDVPQVASSISLAFLDSIRGPKSARIKN